MSTVTDHVSTTYSDRPNQFLFQDDGPRHPDCAEFCVCHAGDECVGPQTLTAPGIEDDEGAAQPDHLVVYPFHREDIDQGGVFLGPERGGDGQAGTYLTEAAALQLAADLLAAVEIRHADEIREITVDYGIDVSIIDMITLSHSLLDTSILARRIQAAGDADE
ncbi:hypothetical protein KIH31_08465 [Paenarthrobacter sp. DKR-5]|uniref:hypothetical protein n=1 Tax=Paenarthrobacter sp. DKR-5 TaxID=2835535 RepID=UPI001BDD2629|nr:hypothetical protein [Paenarthrobacter sp. DKR-5]MBT1002634.1 hypothetical protein [Paenarthrobacter sp. DKR-5]